MFIEKLNRATFSLSNNAQSGYLALGKICFFRIKAQRSNRESDLLRRELADMYFKARGKKIAKREKALCEANANLLMMKEREALRRSKNRRLLNRAKQKDKLMEDLVKDFISKLENEAVNYFLLNFLTLFV